MRTVLLVAAAVALAFAGVCLPAARASPPRRPRPATAPAAVRSVFSPLADAPPLPPLNTDLAALAARYPAFHHRPFDEAGYNALVLPFHYRADPGVGDPAEAYGYSFLVSHTLDWSPSNYCSRHGYFIFRRERERAEKLAQAYDGPTIGELVRGWSATHAVGGELVRDANGYHGTLEVYDARGTRILDKRYDAPRSIFDLLGDMAADVMEHFGDKPSPELRELIHQKRCDRPESLVELGRAAFIPGWTREERDAYEAILKLDPGFADLRCFWANQKHWSDGNKGFLHRELGTALSAGLVESGLGEFNPTSCPDPELRDQWPDWVARCEEMLPADHPLLVQLKLKKAFADEDITPDLLSRATTAAARYPNSFAVISCLPLLYMGELGSKTVDGEMAASVALGAARCRFLCAQPADKTLPLVRFTNGRDAGRLPRRHLGRTRRVPGLRQGVRQERRVGG